MCLLANPGQQQALVHDPELITSAVEEILRAPGRSGGGIPRYARTDLQIGEVTVRAGELVLLDNRAANHDPSVFPSSGRVDIARQGPAHLSFGHGAHYCLGAPLARIELQAVFSPRPARFPGMRLAVPVEELRCADRRPDQTAGGVVEPGIQSGSSPDPPPWMPRFRCARSTRRYHIPASEPR